jgi:hypothetical protein
MNAPSLKSDQMVTIAYLIGIVIILFIVYKILAATGLIKTAAAKKADEAKASAIDTLRTGDIFDPEYFVGKKFNSLGAPYIAKYAEELHKAIAGAGTDEEAIFTVFGELKNKMQVSELANGYQQKYGGSWLSNGSLKTDLLGDLSATDAATLMAIINKLPNT